MEFFSELKAATNSIQESGFDRSEIKNSPSLDHVRSRKVYQYKIIFPTIITSWSLTLPTLCITESCIKTKINLIFYFHTSLWCLKRLYEGRTGLHKTF